MKPNQLALALITAAGLLAACSDEPKKPEKGTKTEQTAADLAQQAEDRYKANITLVSDVYKKMYGKNLSLSPFSKFESSVSDYQRGENGAKAKSGVTIEFAPHFFNLGGQGFTLNSEDNISYSQDLYKEGVVARVEHKFELADPAALKAWLKDNIAVSDANSEAILALLKNVKSRSDLLVDDNVYVVTEIAPFQIQEGDNSLDFKGYKGEDRYNSKTLADGLVESKIAIEPFTFTAVDTVDGSSATVAVSALKGEYAIKDDGNFNLKVEPIKTEITGKKGLTIFELDGITGSGSGVKFDPDILGYLGSTNLDAKNLRVTHNGELYHLGDINSKNDTRKTASGNYDSNDEIAFIVDGASIKKFFPQMPVEVQSVKIKSGISEFSAKSFFDLVEGYYALNNQMMETERNLKATADKMLAEPATESVANEAAANTMDDKAAEVSGVDYEKIMREKFGAALQEVIKNKTRATLDFEGQTDSGKVTASSSIGIRVDSSTGVEEWQKAIANIQNDQETLKNLLKNNLEFKAELRVSKTLTDKLGVSVLIELQGAEYISIEDEEYVAKVENRNGELTINGKPLSL